MDEFIRTPSALVAQIELARWRRIKAINRECYRLVREGLAPETRRRLVQYEYELWELEALDGDEGRRFDGN